MKKVFRQIPLYRFLLYCEQEAVDKTVLDCGAGGDMPPLSLFADFGYSVSGIEFSEKQIKRAGEFGRDNNRELNIIKGDMRALPFEDRSFGCVYSYNSVFHMKKSDIQKAVNEMKRVLMPGGLIFVNLLSTDDEGCGDGRDLGENQYIQIEDEEVIHSYYRHEEAEGCFKGLEPLWKERRLLNRIHDGHMIRQGYIDYIYKKPDA